MLSLTLKLTLQDDVVLSNSSATAGIHGSLDYIPGSTLLGAMASETYSVLEKDNQAWNIFHSGKVRFGNALPLVDKNDIDSIGYPIPLCLHTEKSSPNDFHNLIWSEEGVNSGKQMVQVRDGYLTECGNRFKPLTHYSMKTAINPNTGSASEGQLFGYEALRAGQSFVTSIQCDEEDDYVKVKDFFKQGKTLRLGRSRSAQYGRVKIEVISFDRNYDWKMKNGYLVVWLASDCIANDLFGQPTLNPSGKELGLSSGDLVLEKSFIRTRMINAFNAKRKHYDLTHEAISKGSVLVFENVELSAFDKQKLNTGLGLHTELGYGQVVRHSCAQNILLEKSPSINEWQDAKHTPTIQVPNSILADKLQNLLQEGHQVKEARKIANQAFETLTKHYISGRNFSGMMIGIPFGPSNSQWGRIRDVAQEHRGQQIIDWIDELKDVCKPSDDDWRASTGSSNHSESFGSWLLDLAQPDSDNIDYDVADVLRILAHKASQSSELENIRIGKYDRSNSTLGGQL